jgi:hypothetical protein
MIHITDGAGMKKRIWIFQKYLENRLQELLNRLMTRFRVTLQ